MNIIKDKNKVSLEYAKKLAEWLRLWSATHFIDPSVHAVSEDDFEHFRTIKTDRMHMIRHGEVMLVDLEDEQSGSAYYICELTKRKHKLCSGRVVTLKPLYRVIATKELRGWKAGYFLIPDLSSEQITMPDQTKCTLPKDWWRGKKHWEGISFTEHDPVKASDGECWWWECSHCGAKLSK